MKILFVTRKYPPSTGGMELFARDLSDALSTKTPVKLVKWSRPGRLAAVLIALPYLTVRSFFALAGGSVDVIHVQDAVLAPTAWLLSKIFRKPWVVVVHGLDATYTNLLFKAVVPAAVSRANAVICISQATADAVRQAGVLEAKILVIPLAVTDEIYGNADRAELLGQLNLPPSSQIILSVGRLVRRKGVAWFINNVLPDLARRYPDLVYLVVGEGEERANIENAIRRHKLGHQVHLLGGVSGEVLTAVYNGADVFVMPNIRVAGDMEGFGLVLLEAALCALPVVAAGLEGIKDAIINEKNGVLVPPGQAAEFREQIGGFLDDKKYAKHFGARSRRYTLETYRWDKIAERYLELYSQLR